MEEWTELARTVPGTLLRVAEGTIGLLGTLDSAHRKLDAFIQLMRSVQRGDVDAAIRDRDGVHRQPTAGKMLDDARRELVRLRELHRMASQVFGLYGGMRPGLLANPLWQTWVAHSGETLGHASLVLQSLRSATSHFEASKDAFLMGRSFPTLSQDWAAWVAAALNLLRRAICAGTKAMHAAGRMRDAVTVELEDARRVLLIP